MRKILFAAIMLLFPAAAFAQADRDYKLSQQDIMVIVNALNQNRGILEAQLLQKLTAEVNALKAEDAKTAAKKVAPQKTKP